MKLNPNSWHYKVYVFNSQLNARWNDHSDFVDFPHHGNNIGLCPYMRMIFVWGPLTMLAYVATIAVIVGTVWVFPSGATGGITGTLWLLGTLSAIIGGLLGIAYVSDWRQEKTLAKHKERLELKDSMTYNEWQEHNKPPETFWTLCRDYLKSMKTKICPVLEINND
jgi:hypothetical protein